MHSEKKLEYVVIHLRIKSTEEIIRPSSERRPLIIDEKAPVSNGRNLADIFVIFRNDNFAFLNRLRIGKPYPGTDTHEFGNPEEAVDRSSLITSGDHQHVFTVCAYGSKKKHFPFSTNI